MTRQTEREVGRKHREMDRPGVHQVPEVSGEQRKMEETGCEVICGAQAMPSGYGIGEGESEENAVDFRRLLHIVASLVFGTRSAC